MTMKALYGIALFLSVSISHLFAYNVTVAKDGSGDVKTVQEAFNKVPDNNSSTFTIFVKKGTYREKLKLTSLKKNVSLYGENKTTTILTYDDWGNKSGVGGTDNTYSTLIEADNFYAENITFENTIDSREAAYTTGGQAVALMLTGDKTTLFNCIVRGFQDTFYTKGLGRAYIKCSQIEGTTDFIFGAGIAVFDNCTLVNKKNSHTTAAANQSTGNKYNYVFLYCKLISAEGANSVTLGRPWKAYAKVAYLYCEEGSHIKAEGWSDWSSASYASTAYFAEYKCTGAGFQPASRLSWTHQLTDAEAANYTLAKIFAANAASPAYNSSWTPAVASTNCSIATSLASDLVSSAYTFASPNPASNLVEIGIGNYYASSFNIRIYDPKGQLVKELLKAPANEGQIHLSTTDLANGLYLYQLEDGTIKLNGKFVVSK